MHSNFTHHDAMNPVGAAGAPDQQFLDEVFERAVRLVEDGLVPETDALLAGHEALRAEVERLVQLARHVAVGGAAPHPALAGFTILQQLGQGGMGTVYLARQHSLGGRPVALKVLPNSAALSTRARARFLAEATAIARLRHPNIVAVHDVVHQGDVYAYAMEWIDGWSLGEAIGEKGTEARGHEGTKWEKKADRDHQFNERLAKHDGHPILDPSCLSASVPSCLSIADVCHIGLDIARALAAVHDAGLLHRDVKPSNILLRRDGTPLLADFGLARELDSSVYTQAGHFAGTVAYAPPEQLRGDTPAPAGRGQGEGGVDARSDIYALGVTLYHALAMRLPFDARNPTAMLRRIEAGAATPLRRVNPRVPRDLETIVAKAMEADPARRYQTAGELADDLERFMNYQPIRARPAGLITRGVKLVRRNRGAALGLTIGGLLAMGLAGLLVTYFFFVPGWTAGHVREARLILLDPNQANSIVSSLYWGRYSRMDPTAWESRLRDYDRALKAYDAALRLAPFDEAIRRERAVVQSARDAKPREEAGARIPSRTDGGRNPFPRANTTTHPWEGIPTDVRARRDSRTSNDDPRSAGLFAFLTQDYDAALAHWAEYDKSRNPLDKPDPLVDAAIGILYLFDDQAPRAYPRLQRAAEAFPGVGFIMEYLADAAAKCGDTERARRWLEESKRLPRRDTLGAASRIEAGVLAAEGRTDEAIAAYRAMPRYGAAQIELASLLQREGRFAEAMDEYLQLPGGVNRTSRVSAAYRGCAEKWWAALPRKERLHRIRSAEDDGPASILRELRQYVAAAPRQNPESRTLAEAERRTPASAFQISNLKFQILTTLFRTISSPPLEGLSLNELAERMEVENMSLWSRIYSYPRILKELQFAALRCPALRSVSCLANSAFVAFDEACQRRTRLSHLAAMSAATLALGALASQRANGQCTTPPCFQGLGDLPGAETSSYANAVSADGSTVVGQSSSASSVDDGVFEYEPFRWRIDTGMVGLGDLPGNEFGGEALGVSGDGSMVVGRSRSANSSESDNQEAFLWTLPGGMAALGDRPNGPFKSAACAISDDGTIVTGWSSGDEDNRLSYWTNGAGWISVDSSSPLPSSGEGISPNGLWHVGSRHHGGGTYEACRWSQSTGFELLGQPLGTTNYSDVQGVSNQGEIVGTYRIASGLVAFRWSANGAVVALGDFAEGPFGSSSRAITADGEFIVGYGTTALGKEAALWDAALTMYRVADVLAQHGVQVPVGWLLTSAQDITVNGDVVTICGNGVNPLGYPDAWIARYTLTPACNPADVLQSPSAATVPFGGTVQFSVVAGGTGPLTYQWRKGGVNLTDGPVGCGGTIAGTATDTLVLNTVTFVEGGSYDCVVTNACGSDTSTAATLTINPPPAAADVNHDGQVNGLDIQALVNALLAP